MNETLNETWMATDGESIWPMEHEGDYNDGDTVICVKVTSRDSIEVSARKQDQEPKHVQVTL